jgi:hypothetical protein
MKERNDAKRDELPRPFCGKCGKKWESADAHQCGVAPAPVEAPWPWPMSWKAGEAPPWPPDSANLGALPQRFAIPKRVRVCQGLGKRSHRPAAVRMIRTAAFFPNPLFALTRALQSLRLEAGREVQAQRP